MAILFLVFAFLRLSLREGLRVQELCCRRNSTTEDHHQQNEREPDLVANTPSVAD